MNEPLKRILMTLSSIEVKGRQNMALLLQAYLQTESGQYEEAVMSLAQLTVAGKDNIDMALGCMIELEKLAQAEETEKKEVRTDGD